MYDLYSLSLNTLIHVSKDAKLIDEYRMTDWVVVLKMDEEEVVMNHSNAIIFLQGLIRGSFRHQKLAEMDICPRLESMPLARRSGGNRTLVG